MKGMSRFLAAAVFFVASALAGVRTYGQGGATGRHRRRGKRHSRAAQSKARKCRLSMPAHAKRLARKVDDERRRRIRRDAAAAGDLLGGGE